MDDFQRVLHRLVARGDAADVIIKLVFEHYMPQVPRNPLRLAEVRNGVFGGKQATRARLIEVGLALVAGFQVGVAGVGEKGAVLVQRLRKLGHAVLLAEIDGLPQGAGEAIDGLVRHIAALLQEGTGNIRCGVDRNGFGISSELVERQANHEQQKPDDAVLKAAFLRQLFVFASRLHGLILAVVRVWLVEDGRGSGRVRH